MVKEIKLAVEEVHGGGKHLQDVGKHVPHVFIDASAVSAAVNPFAILGEHWKLEGFGGVVPA